MGRKKTIYTHEFPYHIRARCNNKEWFGLPLETIWSIFSSNLNLASEKFDFKVHAFVLMGNHYHLIATASREFNLGVVMCWIQTKSSRDINSKSGRINHIFGGRYRPTLIYKESYYYHCLKYLYRNPVKANLCTKVEDYFFSSLENKTIKLVKPDNGIDSLIPILSSELLDWLNQESKIDDIRIGTALRKSVFELKDRATRRLL